MCERAVYPRLRLGLRSGASGAERVEIASELLAQLFLQAVFQFGTDLGDFHAGADEKLAAQEVVRAIFIGKFADDAAVLAILIPAEASIGNGFRADVLEAAEDGVLLGDLESLSQILDFDQPLVRAEDLASFVRRDWFRHW